MDIKDCRDQTILVFFQSNSSGRVIGHLKYLYLTLLDNDKMKNSVLLVTTNREEFEDLYRKGYPVAYWTVSDGHQHTWNAIARSKFIFIDEFEFQMPQELRMIAGKGKFINLWHGKDGKHLGYKYLEISQQFNHYISVLDSIRSDARILSPGKGEHDASMKDAFPGARIFNAPDIRTWGIFDSQFEDSIGVDLAALSEIKNRRDKFKVLWCPTFRDEQILNPYEEISFPDLNHFCESEDLHIFIKLHRHEKRLIEPQAGYTNIHMIDTASDVYPLVKYFQMTMTDYSSIIVDFIENNIPTVLFQFDFQKFTSFRKMRPLSNIDKIETLFSLKELEIFLRSKSNSYVDRTNFRDIEQEKSIWVAFIADLLKSS
jgi:hypothetical protein